MTIRIINYSVFYLLMIPLAFGQSGISDSNVDIYGDPIPYDAIGRLGTERFRVERDFRHALCFSHSGDKIVSVDRHGSISWFDVKTGKRTRRVGGRYLSCRFCIDGSRNSLAVLETEFDKERVANCTLSQYDVSTGRETHTSKWKDPPAADGCLVTGDALCYSAGGNRLIIADRLRLREYDLLKGEFSGEIEIPDDRLRIDHVEVFSTNQQVGTIAVVRRHKLYLRGNGEWETIDMASRITAMRFSPDGQTLAVAVAKFKRGPSIYLVDLQQPDSQRALRAPFAKHSYSKDIAFSPDGALIAAASIQKDSLAAVTVWNVQSGRFAKRFPTPRAPVTSVAFSPNGKKIACVENDHIALWDFENENRLAQNWIGHRGSIGAISFSSDGNSIATASDDRTIRLWDRSTTEQKSVFEHENWVRAVAFSPDGETIASSSLDDSVRIWDRNDDVEIRRLKGNGKLGGNRSVSFSPDNRQLVAWGDHDMIVRQWNASNGKPLSEFKLLPGGADLADGEMHQMMQKTVAISPSTRKLILWTDRESFLFDATTGKQIKAGIGSGQISNAVFVGNDNRVLLQYEGASERNPNGQSSSFELMDLKTNRVLWTHTTQGTSRWGNGFASTPSGDRIVLALLKENRYDLLILDGTTGKRHGVIEGVKSIRPMSGRAMSLSADGRYLAIGTSFSSALIWDLSKIMPTSSIK